MRTKTDFKKIWSALLDIKAAPGYEFNNLIDLSDVEDDLPNFTGACANVIATADSVREALEIIELGLKEKNFSVKFIDNIKNLHTCVENHEINPNMIKEAEWLYSSGYRFMISDKLWPYK